MNTNGTPEVKVTAVAVEITGPASVMEDLFQGLGKGIVTGLTNSQEFQRALAAATQQPGVTARQQQLPAPTVQQQPTRPLISVQPVQQRQPQQTSGPVIAVLNNDASDSRPVTDDANTIAHLRTQGFTLYERKTPRPQNDGFNRIMVPRTASYTPDRNEYRRITR